MAEYESCFTATVTRHIRMTRHHRHVQTSVGCCQFIGKFSEEASILLEVAGSELSGSHGRRLEHGYGLLHVSRVHMDPEEEIICLAFFSNCRAFFMKQHVTKKQTKNRLLFDYKNAQMLRHTFPGWRKGVWNCERILRRLFFLELGAVPALDMKFIARSNMWKCFTTWQRAFRKWPFVLTGIACCTVCHQTVLWCGHS